MKKIIMVIVIVAMLIMLSGCIEAKWDFIDEGVVIEFHKTTQATYSIMIGGNTYFLEGYVFYDAPLAIGDYYYLYGDYTLGGQVYRLFTDELPTDKVR